MNDHRTQLTELLRDYDPVDDDDREQRERILQFISKTPTCFERSNREGHVTGSAWVINGSGTHALLTHHKKLGKWLQLGGHADGNPDLMRVAAREAEEESGLRNLEPVSPRIFDVDIHSIPEHGKEPAHFHYDIRFAFRVAGDETFKVSDESHELAWIDMYQLDTYTQEKSMLRMRDKWIGRADVAS